MAKETPLQLFIGTDFFLSFMILNSAETQAIDITGWALSFMVKVNENDADADALMTITTADNLTVSGTYNVTVASNTQTAIVRINDTDTTSLKPGRYVYELKRTDDDNETILAYGSIDLIRSVHT